MASVIALVPYVGFIISCIAAVESADILVGGMPRSWRIPASPLESLNVCGQEIYVLLSTIHWVSKHVCVWVLHSMHLLQK